MLTCKFENGKEAESGLRHVTVDTIVLKDNKILMVKRTGKILEGGKLMSRNGLNLIKFQIKSRLLLIIMMIFSCIWSI